MKTPRNTAKLLDLPYAPEAEACSTSSSAAGSFASASRPRSMTTAANPAPATTTPGAGAPATSSITDWWTAGRVSLRVGPGIPPRHGARAHRTIRWCCARRTARPRGARGLPRPDPRRVHVAHHLQRRQRVERQRRWSSGSSRSARQPGAWSADYYRTDRRRHSPPACRSPVDERGPESLGWCTGSQRRCSAGIPAPPAASSRGCVWGNFFSSTVGPARAPDRRRPES